MTSSPLVAPHTSKIIKNNISISNILRAENFLQNGILIFALIYVKLITTNWKVRIYADENRLKGAWNFKG